MQNKNIAIYARFSSDNQNPKSIGDQYRKCEESISSAYGQDVNILRYSDEAISGTRTDRPDYQRMIRDGLDGKFEALVVDDLSRLSRDTLESHRILKEFKFYGIRIIAGADGIDTANEGYKLQAGIKALMNEEYIDALSKKTFRGMEGRAIEGKHCGGSIYGYDIIALNGDDGSILKINDEQAKWVTQIFEWYADGYTPRWIAAKLNELGVESPRKGKKIAMWCSNAIYGDLKRLTGMLNCETYRGRLVWNKRKWQKTPDGRRIPKLNPPSQWKVTERTDLRIISDVLWNRVKNRQKQIHDKSSHIRTALHNDARSGRGPKYLLSGLLKCGECNANYVLVNKHEYGCAIHRDRGGAACSNKLKVKRLLLESRIFGSFKDILLTPENIAHFEHEAKRHLAAALKEKNQAQGSDQYKLKHIEQEISNLIKALKSGIVSTTIQQELEKLEQEKQVYEKRLNVELYELKEMHRILPVIKNSFTDILNGTKAIPTEKIAKLRNHVQMLLGQPITLKNIGGLVAEVHAQYSGLLKLSGISGDKLSVVAGARFELTTFRL